MLKFIYGRLRRLFPEKLNKKLTVFLFRINIKPRINKKVKSPFEKGIITFSADFEMAWAFRYSKSVDNATQIGLLERKNLLDILHQFNENKIPVCWATVGHLFLENCKKINGIAHPEMLRPAFLETENWLFNEGDWYDSDPCTNYKEDPAWYAPDLVDAILESPVNHEIACHTFSHIDFTDKNCPLELAKSELIKCKELASNKNISLKSMVFPGGTAGNYKVLKEEGFTCYRKPMKYDIDLPFKDKYGLVAIPSSFSLEGEQRLLSVSQYIKMAKSFIDAAIKYKLVCHFWFHPSMDPWYRKNVLPELLQLVSKYQMKKKVEVLTMHDIAERFKNND